MASRMGNQQNHERIPQEGEVDVLEEENDRIDNYL